MLTISGHSDDLIELDGDISEEYSISLPGHAVEVRARVTSLSPMEL